MYAFSVHQWTRSKRDLWLKNALAILIGVLLPSETLMLTIAAVSLIAMGGTHFLTVGFSASRALLRVIRQRDLELRELRQAAQIARLTSELQFAGSDCSKPGATTETSTAGSSVQWRVMEVAEIIVESSDCRSYYLIDPYRQPLPDFLPGQHVLVRPALAGAYQTTRCYSLSSSPDRRYWRITVKRQSAEPSATTTANLRRAQNGGLSGWLHETIGIGDCLLVGGPSGHYFLADNHTKPLVLLAAGVGITPLASMLRWSMEHHPKRPIALLYQAKDLAHWPLGRTLHSWLASSTNCRIQSYFSRESNESLADFYARQQPAVLGQLLPGKFGHAQVLAAQPSSDCDYFLCGPNAWMDALRTSLTAAGVEPNQIHWESFGSAGAPVQKAEVSIANAVPVRFEHSQIEALWYDAEQSLWELAREHQVAIPNGCLSGVCGSCKVKLLAGQIEYDRPVSLELAEDECLSCVARPLTSCCIDA